MSKKKEAQAFLDGMAAMWEWSQSKGMRRSVQNAQWQLIAGEICEDRDERNEVEYEVMARFEVKS